jgi:hypothetical protein
MERASETRDRNAERECTKVHPPFFPNHATLSSSAREFVVCGQRCSCCSHIWYLPHSKVKFAQIFHVPVVQACGSARVAPLVEGESPAKKGERAKEVLLATFFVKGSTSEKVLLPRGRRCHDRIRLRCPSGHDAAESSIHRVHHGHLADGFNHSESQQSCC